MVCIVSANSPKYFRIRHDKVILICLSFVLPVITGGAKIRIFISAYRVQHLSYERKLCLILQYLSDFLMTSAYLLISCHNHRSSCLTQKMGKILFLAMVSGSGYFAILVVPEPYIVFTRSLYLLPRTLPVWLCTRNLFIPICSEPSWTLWLIGFLKKKSELYHVTESSTQTLSYKLVP